MSDHIHTGKLETFMTFEDISLLQIILPILVK